MFELLNVVLPRFKQMQNAPDGVVGLPGVLVLNRLIDLSSDELAAAARPLVTFVGAFVSAETPDSQIVANWPAGVRAGSFRHFGFRSRMSMRSSRVIAVLSAAIAVSVDRNDDTAATAGVTRDQLPATARGRPSR